MTVIEKEIPIKITFSNNVIRPRQFNQHIKRIRVYGPADRFPEELRLDADEIAEGGVLTIDDLALPDEFEVLDRRDVDAIVTVPRPSKAKRSKRDDDRD